MPKVVITGATGFIGRHVVRDAQRRRLPLRLVAHRTEPPATPHGTEIVSADLRDPDSLRGVCDGADVLLHCASQIGGSRVLCEAVNARGTRALVDDARRSGVSRIVYLSTAAVYGRGVFRQARPEDLARAPLSDPSRTRAAAEDSVLAAGGIVLRPHLVYGVDDTRVVPAMLRMAAALPGTVEGWSARTSAVAAEDLARAIVTAGLAPAERFTASVYHANHPRPEPWSAVLRAVAATAAVPWPRTDLTYREASAFLEARGRSPHDLDMVTTDHWFDSDPLWRDLACDPGPGFPGRFPRYAPWYRQLLTARNPTPGP
ncbi:NAD-dependent epimerase/dehydratase family protein [Streptomyces sp. NPDC002990]